MSYLINHQCAQAIAIDLLLGLLPVYVTCHSISDYSETGRSAQYPTSELLNKNHIVLLSKEQEAAERTFQHAFVPEEIYTTTGGEGLICAQVCIGIGNILDSTTLQVQHVRHQIAHQSFHAPLGRRGAISKA
jgi:hypothetical protein